MSERRKYTVHLTRREHAEISVPTGVGISTDAQGQTTVTESGFVRQCRLCGGSWPCLPAQLAAANARADAALVEAAELRRACLVVTDDYNHGISRHCRLCANLFETNDDRHEPSCLLAAEPGTRGAEIVDAANAMAEAIEACETSSVRSQAYAERYRALMAGPVSAGEGG